jgi:hypothetical protein
MQAVSRGQKLALAKGIAQGAKLILTAEDAARLRRNQRGKDGFHRRDTRPVELQPGIPQGKSTQSILSIPSSLRSQPARGLAGGRARR